MGSIRPRFHRSEFRVWRPVGHVAKRTGYLRAHDYANKHPSSEYQVILVARVALGKGFPVFQTQQNLTEPPLGYHSVRTELHLLHLHTSF